MRRSALPQTVLVVGAGPAGMSCALWLHNLGLKPRLIERTQQLGGLMNLNTLPNNWVLGQVAHTGPEMAAQFARHLATLPIPISLGVERFEVRRVEDIFEVRCWQAGVLDQIFCAALVLATGTRVRAEEVLAGVAGLETVETGMIRYGPAAFEDLKRAALGCTVIIGGGDNAAENAHMLLAAGGKVVLLARSKFRAQAALMAQITEHPRARCLQQARLQEIRIEGCGMALAITSPQGTEWIHAQRVHVLAGYEPNADLSDSLGTDIFGPMRRDAQGYLCVDAWGRCAVPGVYAAGDVCNAIFPNVVSAMAQGAQVAKAIEQDLRLTAQSA